MSGFIFQQDGAPAVPPHTLHEDAGLDWPGCHAYQPGPTSIYSQTGII